MTCVLCLLKIIQNIPEEVLQQKKVKDIEDIIPDWSKEPLDKKKYVMSLCEYWFVFTNMHPAWSLGGGGGGLIQVTYRVMRQVLSEPISDWTLAYRYISVIHWKTKM